jgi:electron transfer flavoprotein alpha subunit
MLAVIPVRDGQLPAGGAETVAECGGRALLAGSAPELAAGALDGLAHELHTLELGDFEPGRWAVALAAALDAAVPAGAADVLVVPASPDGRDLAPRLAHALDRPLLAGAVEVTATRVHLARAGGLELHEALVAGPVVVTLQPGVRGVAEAASNGSPGRPGPSRPLAVEPPAGNATGAEAGTDATVVQVLAPDVTTMDLAEAGRIIAGGAGLDSVERFRLLPAVAAALGASMGATRVITDRGWVTHERQIGTTGVVVDPRLYVALGISGAVQHTAGLGSPEHVISVNTDPHCPMMQLADLAVVSDANAVLDELARQLDLAEALGG